MELVKIYHMRMPGSLVSITILAIFCVSAAGNRTSLFSGKSVDGLSASPISDKDGVCSSMIKNHGYSCQEHNVTTKDGYILSLQRIPTGRSGGNTGTRPPVMLVHGVFMDSVIWLVLTPDKSLPFILADNGFDVWLINNRGTKYSRGHTSLSPNDAAYWDWTLDELVAYDLPETVDYIHNQTGQKLHYLGQSLGTTMAFAAFSRNLLIDKLRSAVLLCPVAYLGQLTSPLARTAAETFVAETAYKFGQREFVLVGELGINFFRFYCKIPGVDCTMLLTPFTGQNCCLDPSISSILLQHEPQSTATKNMIHLAQMIREGTFMMYDYKDSNENVKHYGQATPKPYNLSSIPSNVPLYLSYGGADALTDEKDIQLLLNSLRGHDKNKLVVQRVEKYAHGDYVMGDNAKHVVYDPLIAFLKLHE